MGLVLAVVFNARVQDKGVIVPGQAERWGLVGMRERTQKVGGRFKVTSSPGRGTQVEVIVPRASLVQQTA